MSLDAINIYICVCIHQPDIHSSLLLSQMSLICHHESVITVILCSHAAFFLLKRVEESSPLILQRDEVESAQQAIERDLSLLRLELTLPYLDGVPPHCLQAQACRMVALAIVFNLIRPIVHIGLRQAIHTASFMSMPEASVDEDAGVQTGDDDVGSARKRTSMYAVAKTMAEQEPAHNHLWPSVSRLYLAHAPAALFGGHLVCHSRWSLNMFLLLLRG